MSRFDITKARNATFDSGIDAQLMALTEYITEEHFPRVQDYRDFHPGEPDTAGHLGPEAARRSFDLARPRYNLMVQMLRELKGARGVDIGPAFGFLDVLLVEQYGLRIVATEHPENFPAYTGLLRAKGIEVMPWHLGRDACPIEPESMDFVIFAEVLEHLKAPPLRALREVTAPLKPGGTLFFSTPNIARQHNIDRLQRGENVMEPYREDAPPDRDVTDFVSHIHEYTVQEAVEMVEAAGLSITELVMCPWMMDERPHPDPLRNHYTCLLAKKR